MGKSVNYPTPPDPYRTAEAQGDINRETAVDQTRLNAMNQYTPFGTLTYTERQGTPTQEFDDSAYDIALSDWEKRMENASPGGYDDVWNEATQDYDRVWRPGVDAPPRPDRDDFYYTKEGVPRFDVTQQLSPEQQSLYDRSVGIQDDLLGVGQTQLSRVSDAMGRPLSLANLPGLQVPLRGIGPAGAVSDIGGPDANRASIGDVGGLARDPGAAAALGGAPSVDTNRAGLGSLGAIQSSFGSGGTVQGNLPINTNRAGIGQTYGIQQSVGADDFGDDRQRVEEALMARMQPYLDRRRDAERTSLVNQGFSDTGSEGYVSAMDNVNRQENDAMLAAIAQAGQEQSRLFGMDVAAGQFANQAAGQDYAQTAGRAAFDNANIDANLNARLAQMGANNQAVAQRYAQNAGQAQFANQAQQQGFAQSLAGANLDNANIDANFANQMAAADFERLSQGQQYSQALARQQAINAAQGQAFQQDATRAAFDNANQDTYYQQLMAQQAANNAAQGQRFGQEVARVNDVRARAAAVNATRQQALQERLLQRQTPINELSAFLSQGQLTMPQFANTPQASIAAPNFQDAAYASYNAQASQAAQEQQANQALMQGLFSLGGAGLGAFGAINPFGWGGAAGGAGG